MSSRPPGFWLFSARIDLAAFLGSFLLAMVALAVGGYFGLLDDHPNETPNWAWVPAVLLVDVAHVWATGFRVYFDRAELRRRAALYLAVPVIGYAVGVALYSEGAAIFWRVLAYVAVFHFVRQQYGWVALYRARVGEHGRLGRWIDTAAVYLATVYPLIYWHAHLPREFWWFRANDFAALPELLEEVVRPLYVLALAAYTIRAGWLWLVARKPNPGKDIVVVTTAICWYVGIIHFNSDYAFTVTNVLIHGIPYLALIYWYRYLRDPHEGPTTRAWPTLVTFLGVVWVAAYAEELLWDRGVWHERAWLFGGPWDASGWQMWLVPLLALPQLTHYVLDGFIWKRKSNPDMAKEWG